MKKLIVGVFMMLTMLACVPEDVTADPQAEAAIKTIVESVGVFADLGDFDALEKVYADPVEVDYTSLNGGEVELKSPQALMQEWASVLPGFDRTRHEISKIRVSINAEDALATARVKADHYLGDQFWQVRGEYRYNLNKQEDGLWRITSHTFLLKKEKGTRDIFEPAMENARANPAAYIRRQQTQQAVIDMLTSLEDKDMEKFASVWADDAVQEMPYSPEGFPTRISGKENLIAHYAGWPETSGEADFTSKLVFYPMQDPEMVFAEYDGKVDIIPTGRLYEQQYGGLYHVTNGKITLFREYYNPIPFVWAFGLDEEEGAFQTQ